MFILKLLNNRSGNAYIYVLIVMMYVFIMLRLVINITSHSVLISEAALKSSNLYSMSKAGVDKGVYILNNVIFTNKHNINNRVLKSIQDISYKDIVVFLPYEDNLYNGRFLFRQEYDLYKTLFKNYSSIYIANFIAETNGHINLNINNYNIDIFIENNPIISKDYKIISVATDTSTNISLTLEAVISFVGEVYNEVLFENYIWYDMPPYFLSTINKYANFNEIFNTQVRLYENIWSYEYPILFNNNYTLSIDLANFYYNDYPTSTVIIHNGKGELYIYTSDERKNIFNGIIISLGNIIFLDGDYNIEGSLISRGYIKYYNLYTKINSDILLNLEFNNIIYQRKLYDALFLTDFLSGNGYPLKRLGICNKSPIEINVYQPITLQILYLKLIN